MTALAVWLCLQAVASSPADPFVERMSLGLGGAWREPRTALRVSWRTRHAWRLHTHVEWRARRRSNGPSESLESAPSALPSPVALQIGLQTSWLSICVGACQAPLSRWGGSMSVRLPPSLAERPLALAVEIRPQAFWVWQASISQRPASDCQHRLDRLRHGGSLREVRLAPLVFRSRARGRMQFAAGSVMAQAQIASQVDAPSATSKRSTVASSLWLAWERHPGGVGVRVSRHHRRLTGRASAHLVLCSGHVLAVSVEGPNLPWGIGLRYSATLTKALRVRLLVHQSARRPGLGAHRLGAAASWRGRLGTSVVLHRSNQQPLTSQMILYGIHGRTVSALRFAWRGRRPQALAANLATALGTRRPSRLSFFVQWTPPGTRPPLPMSSTWHAWLSFGVGEPSRDLSLL